MDIPIQQIGEILGTLANYGTGAAMGFLNAITAWLGGNALAAALMVALLSYVGIDLALKRVGSKIKGIIISGVIFAVVFAVLSLK